jgi:hypothetical protein
VTNRECEQAEDMQMLGIDPRKVLEVDRAMQEYRRGLN